MKKFVDFFSFIKKYYTSFILKKVSLTRLVRSHIRIDLQVVERIYCHPVATLYEEHVNNQLTPVISSLVGFTACLRAACRHLGQTDISGLLGVLVKAYGFMKTTLIKLKPKSVNV